MELNIETLLIALIALSVITSFLTIHYWYDDPNKTSKE